MAAGHGHVKVLSLYAGAFVLHDADAYVLDVDHGAEWQQALVCCDGQVCRDRCAAGRDSCTSAADVGSLLGAVCRAGV